ncbi:phosphoadenosine phosphosulfate reductase family protein [Prolixibacter sp. SD074]|uniref:phosphoadenosine phosphosulfate reductase domain-containing protein n=1 Tax=Prolixibacter sp. SD074 TaxID=2652391 RepID=UPI0012709594|nr:phosphoadenosine phosphosulfate reductase family protein [Prolixibacter sp. SD074]GET28815.1 hypothetical protein SD074_10170 [Prolixibacter sp. SD074]
MIREVAWRFKRPVLLFSGGKDLIVMFHLAHKAFWSDPIPFPLLHIDTGHNFPETLAYRDKLVKESGSQLIVCSVEESIAQGKAVEETGIHASRNKLQTVTLLDALEKLKVDAALGGGRRDEEKARAKERFFSHERPVIERDGILLADSPYLIKKEDEKPVLKEVRCRTIGDMTCTGVTLSPAASLDEIIADTPGHLQYTRNIALSVGGIEVFTKMFLYFLHERAWNRVRIGKHNGKPGWFTTKSLTLLMYSMIMSWNEKRPTGYWSWRNVMWIITKMPAIGAMLYSKFRNNKKVPSPMRP